jgi:hypothetical protein
MTGTDLDSLLDEPDAAFRRELGDALAGLDDEDALAGVLVRSPETFEQLTDRMATLEDIAAFAETDPAAVDQYLTVLWNGVEIVTTNIGSIGAAVTMDTSVNWRATDSPVAFHATTDPSAGTIAGGPDPLDDPEITFEGHTDVLFSMLGDDEFNPPLAYVQNRYEVVGSLERAREFDRMMETVTADMAAFA